MPTKMKSFIHSALKLHADNTELKMGDVKITSLPQFDHMIEGKDNAVDMWIFDKQTQLNYLLLMAAEQGEFENSFVYSALKLFDSNDLRNYTAYSCSITSDVQTAVLSGHKVSSHEICADVSKQHNINFLLLIAAAEGEI